MCDNFIQYFSKYKHPHDRVPCTDCEEALSSCTTSKNLVPLVIGRFREFFFRCSFYEIDMFVRMTIQAIQHPDFNYIIVLNHFYHHHRHRFRNLVYIREVITDPSKAKIIMLIFIDECIKLFSVSSNLKD